MLRFDPATGLYADDTAVIRAETEALWREALGNDVDVSAGSPIGQLIDSQTALVADKDRQVLYLSNQFNPAANEGIWQDALGQIYFQERLGAAPTLVECLCTGLAGTTVSGTVQAATGMRLVTVAPVEIPPTGRVLVSFRTVEEGPIVIPANSVTTIITTVPGWDTVDNPAAGVEGRLIESPQEFEARRKASVANNSQGRAVAINGAVAAVTGVIDSIVIENYKGAPITEHGVTIPAHTFFIAAAGGAGADIAKAIYQKKDGGAATMGNTPITHVDPAYPLATYTYNYEVPANLNITLTATIKATDTTPSDIADKIKKAVTDNFYGRGSVDRVRMASTLYASRFYTPVISAGVEDLVSVTLSIGGGQLNSIEVNANQLPNLADVLTVFA
ncbi:baseplate J/gp47 family protein [Pseudomonas sp. NPDC098747]|uniref:baseplate J/gp47 family protein n=1 Tax=Pseudomonas sp. NPDC098747 TaxID=3364487 RepID=UPI00383B90CB